MITIKKENSYGIIAIVAIVTIVALFSLFSQKSVVTTITTTEEAENLAGQAIRNCPLELGQCQKNLISLRADILACQNDLDVCGAENIALQEQYSSLVDEVCTNFPDACGCTDEDASNYDGVAIIDDDSCEYSKMLVGTHIGNLYICDSEGNCDLHLDFPRYSGDRIYSIEKYDERFLVGMFNPSHGGARIESCYLPGEIGDCDEIEIDGDYVQSMETDSSIGGYYIWISPDNGQIHWCQSMEELINQDCTVHGGEVAGPIYDMVFNGGEVWFTNGFGELKSCGTDNGCTHYNDEGGAYAVEIYDDGSGDKLWLGLNGGDLKSCTFNGVCSSPVNYGSDIRSMANYDGKLWIGLVGGYLKYCTSIDNCQTVVQESGVTVKSMEIFNDELWVGYLDGSIKSCSSNDGVSYDCVEKSSGLGIINTLKTIIS